MARSKKDVFYSIRDLFPLPNKVRVNGAISRKQTDAWWKEAQEMTLLDQGLSTYTNFLEIMSRDIQKQAETYQSLRTVKEVEEE